MGVGPFVEVEAGYRWRREVSAVAYGNYAYFRDDTVLVSNGGYFFSIISVPDRSFAVGARVNYHARAFWVGRGLGVVGRPCTLRSTHRARSLTHEGITLRAASFVATL
jgi:hypothetical protein